MCQHPHIPTSPWWLHQAQRGISILRKWGSIRRLSQPQSAGLVDHVPSRCFPSSKLTPKRPWLSWGLEDSFPFETGDSQGRTVILPDGNYITTSSMTND